MTDQNRYRVVLSGRMMPGHDRDAVIDALVKLFGSSRKQMARLLQGTAVPFKKDYTQQEALRIRDKIRRAGAECAIEPMEAPTPEAVDPDPAEEVTAKPPQPLDAEPDEVAGASAGTAGGGDLMQAILAFVGPNAEYYRQRFARFGDPRRPRFVPTWHWPAFFVFYFWALYRKLWLWAGIHLAGSFLLFYYFAPLVLLFIWLLGWTLAANWLYFRQARSKVLAANAQPPYPDGGVSGRAVLMGLGFILLLNSFLSQFFLPRILEKFEQEFGQLLPESGALLRGDGSVLEMATADSQTKKSVQKISILSVSIKLWLTTKQGQDGTLDFDRLQNELGRDKFIDGWGNTLRIRRGVEGVVIDSSGPDGIFDNTDDILYTIPLSRFEV